MSEKHVVCVVFAFLLKFHLNDVPSPSASSSQLHFSPESEAWVVAFAALCPGSVLFSPRPARVPRRFCRRCRCFHRKSCGPSFHLEWMRQTRDACAWPTSTITPVATKSLLWGLFLACCASLAFRRCPLISKQPSPPLCCSSRLAFPFQLSALQSGASVPLPNPGHSRRSHWRFSTRMRCSSALLPQKSPSLALPSPPAPLSSTHCTPRSCPAQPQASAPAPAPLPHVRAGASACVSSFGRRRRWNA